MDEKRKFERKNLAFFTRLYDRETGRQMGNLDNLTADGIMVIGNEPLETGRVYRINMELDPAESDRSHLNFEARCIWCRPEPLDTPFFNAGFQFVCIDPRDLETIDRILQLYGLRD